ncbi:MAG: 30S ribosomal protein S6, partial [Cloacibacillus sp.]
NCVSLSLRKEEARVQREEVKYVRSYEMVVIFKADIEDHKTVSEETAEIARGLGAEVEKIDLWGKKRFAYPIDKQLEGFYTLYTFKLDPAQVKEMERLLSLKPNIVRQMVVNLEEK